MVRSLTQARTGLTHLEEHLQQARQELLALTPPPGRGKRQIRSQTLLESKMREIEQRHRVSGLLTVQWQKQQQTKWRYRGPGRGSPRRAYLEVQVLYMITEVERSPEAIAAASYRLGWRVQVTNAPQSLVSLPQAICHYRGGWCLERDFHLVKDLPLGLSPLFVWQDDQIKGSTRLLTLALRLLTVRSLILEEREGIKSYRA